MTPNQILGKSEKRLDRPSVVMFSYIRNYLPQDVRDEEILPETTPEFYQACYNALQMFGMRQTNGEESYDRIVWSSATDTLEIVRQVLNEEFKLELPERSVVSLVDEMVSVGMLKIVPGASGEQLVAIEDNPYDIKIRITSVPAGQAPENVREQWVGLELPARFVPGPMPASGLVDGKLEYENQGAFMVPRLLAIELLEKKSTGAAQWFRDNLRRFDVPFMFDAMCAETIQTH